MTNIIETERLILRPLTLADAHTAYNGWTGDLEVSKYVSWLPHHSIDDITPHVDGVHFFDSREYYLDLSGDNI